MPKKKKNITPTDYFDMKERGEKDKKVKQSDVFGKGKKDDKKKTTKKKKKAPPGYHYMTDGKLMKDSEMKSKKTKKVEFLQSLYPTYKSDEITLLSNILDKNDIKQLARDAGLEDKEIKLLK